MSEILVVLITVVCSALIPLALFVAKLADRMGKLEERLNREMTGLRERFNHEICEIKEEMRKLNGEISELKRLVERLLGGEMR